MVFKNLIFLSILTIGAFYPAFSYAQVIDGPPTSSENIPPVDSPPVDNTLPEIPSDDIPAGTTTVPIGGSVGGSVLDNLNWFGGSLGLPDTDPRFIIANLIRQLLGLLGIVLLLFIIYAGFLWMLSGDNDEQRTKAKRTLIGAVIGLIIILSANSIVLFIFRTLSGATTTTPPPI